MSNRRRRPQKSKKANPLKWVLITGTTLLLVLFCGIFAIKAGINSWLRGDGFRDWVKKKSATVLKSEVALEKIEWKDSEVYLNGFKARGYNDAGFSKLDLDGVRVAFDGKADDAWQIPEATVNRLNMEFSKDRIGGEFVRHSMVSTDSDGKSAAPEWVRNYLPEKVELGDIIVDSGNLIAMNEAGEETFGLRNVAATIDPDLETGMWEFSGRSGKLMIPNSPVFELQNFGVRWKQKDLYLTSLSANFMDGARISGTGDVVFGEKTQLNLDLELENLNLHEVLKDETMQERFSGLISGPVKITGVPGSPEGLKQTGTIHIKEGVVTSIDFLNTVAKYTKTEQFRRLGLNEATADFERVGNRILLTNIKIQSDGLTRIEGDLLIEGDTLAGNFNLGVMPGTMRWIPGAEQTVFVEPRDGFLWTPLTITGTFDDISEDLTARIIAAAGEAFIKDLPANVIKKAAGAVKDPIDAPSSLIKDATSIIETLAPLLGR
ncbi:hypothetical protein OAK43_00440 [Verrucomicrobiales bacterium]|nr:hypothetical protein [Verrucomicrobiales bacterium]MDB4657131.1 hypothetical protein [Verrucomicrobiales bacterium]MDC0258686.1 hypothetical protein [Verrucomicrobiales bacterium]MDC0275966.1 hypothetical protein [Verrucomicrobiales bacterium]MDC0314279.1 hypothetical protein [bacterium]